MFPQLLFKAKTQVERCTGFELSAALLPRSIHLLPAQPWGRLDSLAHVPQPST